MTELYYAFERKLKHYGNTASKKNVYRHGIQPDD